MAEAATDATDATATAGATADTVNLDEAITRITVPDEGLVGYVIGRQGRTITRIMRDTSTYIHYEKDTNEFIIEGEPANQYAAKLKVKEIISNGTKTQKPLRFLFIDANRQRFVLETAGMGYPVFKVVLKDSLNKDHTHASDYSGFTNRITNVLKSIYVKRKKDVINNIWSHFGHIYVSGVLHDEEKRELDGQELLGHVKWDNTSNATKWRTKFMGGIDGIESHNLNGWMTNRKEKDLPFIRYEFAYITPLCRVIRVKTFLGLDVTTNSLTYKSIPKCEPTANIIRSSDSYPYFYLCGSTDKRAMADVFQPAEELDFRFIIDSGSTPQYQDEDKEVDALFNFFRANLRVIPDVGLELPQENRPSDFDPCYARVSERRTYTFTSEDDEQFTVKLSYENIVNTPTPTSETKVDIHLQYDVWDKMLEDGTWTPQKIVEKIPQYMKCASSLARILKVQEGIPEEILARGQKAQEAYSIALESGKAKYRRVPVILVGQSRAGKTSLLKSLKREKFNPEEDSTEGVKLHRSLSIAKEDIWHEDVTPEQCLIDCTAQAVAKKLQAPIDLTSGEEEPQEDQPLTREEPNEPKEQNEAKESKEAKEVSLAEEHDNSSLESKIITEDFNEQPCVASDPSLSHGSSFPNQIPEEVCKKASSILQNPGELEKEDNIHLVTLDFAGQPVYAATHPVFLPHKGIYILVHSLENEIHDQATPIAKQGSSKRKVDCHCPMTNMDYLEFWSSFVASLWTTPNRVSIIGDNALELLKIADTNCKITSSSPKRKSLPKKMPPVFLVCTHADKLDNLKVAEEASREILSYFLRDDKDAPGKEHIIRVIYPVNNTVSGESEEKSIKDLRAHIYQVASNLPHVKDIVPIRWLQFEKRLSDLSLTENKKYIPLDEARIAAMQCQIDPNNEFQTVLNYLHDLKVLIHYENTDLVIIDIQWLLDMIVKVITVKPIDDWEEGYDYLWEQLETNGILEQGLINHIWENESTANSLLIIMQRFSLLCPWKKSNSPDIFLVPSMLMNSDAKQANALLNDQKTSRTLVVRFKSAHLPLGIFPRLLVFIAKTCNEKWPDSRQPKFYHNFCRFYDIGGEIGKNFDLLVTSDMKTVSFSVINERGIIGLPLKKLCRFLVEFLKKTLVVMRSSFPWMKNIDFEFCVRCPSCYPSSKSCKYHNVSDCTRDSCLHFITENELRNTPPRCYVNQTSIKTLIEKEIYLDWFDTADDTETSNTTTNVVRETVKLLALEDGSSTSEGSRSHEIVPYSVHTQELAMPENSVITIAKFKELVDKLEPYKSITKDPPAEIVKECRDVCRQLRGAQRGQLIAILRKHVPSGTTGPRKDEKTPYEEMEFNKKKELTRALCGGDIWKNIAEKLGKLSFSLGYYERMDNPVETLFEEECKRRGLTFGKLYDILISCNVHAIADIYL